ncbi:MAG: polyprenyl synthetase family protein [Dehalococcoidia bacterium]|nr:polyprenyl synthetase family protein [Dehalococcoidia bacterium]
MNPSNEAPGRRIYRSGGAVDLGLIAEDLTRVELKMERLMASREPLLSEVALHLIQGGGKRVRPAVALLVFKACGGRDVTDMVDVAIALELIHSATLLHDDIIDGGETRRGRPSAFQRYGLTNTLVTGDFLFSKAFELCGRFEERIVRWAADACISLTEGEIMQGRFRRNPATTTEDYLEIIARKTASLFSQGARVAAHLAGVDEHGTDAMSLCGFNIGMAFQIIDDLLDVEGDARTGKPVGIDLRDGNPSLPLVLAAARDMEVRCVFVTPESSDADIDAALKRVRELGVLAEVRRLAEDYTGRARELLEALPYSSYRQALADIITEVEERRL